jgi:signal transduction histidine kinase
VSQATVEVAALALAFSGVVALVGALVVRLRRRPSVRSTLVALPVLTVLPVVAGVMGAARVMFIEKHDLAVVLPVTAVASLVALLVAWTSGQRLVADVEAVRRQAGRLGDSLAVPTSATTTGPSHAPGPAMRELADIDGEIRQARARLAQAQAREQALEQSRRELVAWISHDLRTPLAGIRAMAEALEDGVAPDPARYHRQLRREVDRLSRMVDDLFELSRIRSGGLSLTMEHIDLRDLVADVLSGSAAVAEAGRVVLGAQADPMSLRADAAGLGRVLTNLVGNAIRHTPAEGTVQVAAQRQGDQVVLSVSDACGGIPVEDLERLFEPGWRGSPARTPGPDGGAGLGLAIARGIVEAHQGQISVCNEGSGCRFDVRLPMAAAPA